MSRNIWLALLSGLLMVPATGWGRGPVEKTGAPHKHTQQNRERPVWAVGGAGDLLNTRKPGAPKTAKPVAPKTHNAKVTSKTRKPVAPKTAKPAGSNTKPHSSSTTTKQQRPIRITMRTRVVLRHAEGVFRSSSLGRVTRMRPEQQRRWLNGRTEAVQTALNEFQMASKSYAKAVQAYKRAIATGNNSAKIKVFKEVAEKKKAALESYGALVKAFKEEQATVSAQLAEAA